MMNKLSPVLLLVIAACDAQVDADHQGEVIAELQGAMRTSLPQSSAAADVSVVWVVGSGGTSFVGADKVEVEGTLPSQFKLSIYTPPSDDVLWDWDGLKFATAYIAAAPVGEDAQQWDSWLGADMDRVLVYVDQDVPPNTALAGLLHGTPKAGYHLYTNKRLTDAEREQYSACILDLFVQLNYMPSLLEIFTECGGTGSDELHPAPADLDTQLDIEIVADFGIPEFNKLPRWSGL